VAVGLWVAVGGSGVGDAVKVGGGGVGVQVSVEVAVGGTGIGVAVSAGGSVGLLLGAGVRVGEGVAVDGGEGASVRVAVGGGDGVSVAVLVGVATTVAAVAAGAAVAAVAAAAAVDRPPQPLISATARKSPLRTAPYLLDRDTMPHVFRDTSRRSGIDSRLYNASLKHGPPDLRASWTQLRNSYRASRIRAGAGGLAPAPSNGSRD
jgi:hypothetical protein